MYRVQFLATVALVLLVGQAWSQQVITITPEFTASGDLAVGPDDNIYVADFGNALGGGSAQSVPGREVYRVSPSGEVSVFATGLFGASGNAFGPDGFLYQSNISGGSISKIAPDGTVTLLTASNLISGPVGIAVDQELNVYNTNCSNNTITKTTPSGQTTVFAQHLRFQCPNGLTIDPEGNLYASNFNNCDVLKIDSQGTVRVFACINAFHPTRNSRGNGHITFANGRLYVCAWQGNQIFEVTLEGDVSLLAGDGASGRDDGSFDVASFNQPNGIDASRTGDTLYVNDTVPISSAGRLLHPNVVRMITGVRSMLTAAELEVPESSHAELLPVYPNPVTGSANLEYKLDRTTHVSLEVFDLFGRRVRHIVKGVRSAGKHKVLLDVHGLPSGTYLYELSTSEGRMQRSFVVVK